jgi:hypothetical protein
MNGSKYDAEAVDAVILRVICVVGERCTSDTSGTVRSRVGAYR